LARSFADRELEHRWIGHRLDYCVAADAMLTRQPRRTDRHELQSTMISLRTIISL
jgi:hypothetical protein